ncbi:MAG: hypothetical protein ACR2OZ_03025 [Verrucomicrobiales bacterium]
MNRQLILSKVSSGGWPPRKTEKTTSRRTFLKQTAMVAGLPTAALGLQGCRTVPSGQVISRIKPHISPPGKPNHTLKIPGSNLRKTVQWDFERFIHEVVARIQAGQSRREIENWIYSDPDIKKRQIIKADLECDWSFKLVDHALGVVVIPPLQWVEEHGRIVGFTIRGEVCRTAWNVPVECRTEKVLSKRARRSGEPRALQVLSLGMLVSSSSSSSSSWPRR